MVEETGAPGENHRHVDQLLSHNVVSRTPHLTWIQTHNASNGALNFLFATRLSSDYTHSLSFLARKKGPS